MMTIIKNLTENFISDIKVNDADADVIVCVRSRGEFSLVMQSDNKITELAIAKMLSMLKLSDEHLNLWVGMAKDIPKLSEEDFITTLGTVIFLQKMTKGE
jgi:hypothetical protein